MIELNSGSVWLKIYYEQSHIYDHDVTFVKRNSKSNKNSKKSPSHPNLLSDIVGHSCRHFTTQLSVASISTNIFALSYCLAINIICTTHWCKEFKKKTKTNRI